MNMKMYSPNAHHTHWHPLVHNRSSETNKIAIRNGSPTVSDGPVSRSRVISNDYEMLVNKTLITIDSY